MNPYRAVHYLGRFGSWEKLSDLYDDDEMLQAAIAVLMPDFEYPNWAHRTIGELRCALGVS